MRLKRIASNILSPQNQNFQTTVYRSRLLDIISSVRQETYSKSGQNGFVTNAPNFDQKLLIINNIEYISPKNID